jgi:hypothetical protein
MLESDCKDKDKKNIDTNADDVEVPALQSSEVIEHKA